MTERLSDLLTKWLATITGTPWEFYFRVGDNAPPWTKIKVTNGGGKELCIMEKGHDPVKLELGLYKIEVLLRPSGSPSTTHIFYWLEVMREEVVAWNGTWGVENHPEGE